LLQVTLQCHFIPKQIGSQVNKGGAGGCHCLQVFLFLCMSNSTLLFCNCLSFYKEFSL
jgi:hypothetical protein